MLFRRLIALVLSLWIGTGAALATQATLVTPAAPLSMAGLASFLNSAYLSIGSCNSGTAAPANGTGGAAFAGECWINTSANPWVFSYTPDGTHWTEFGSLNTSTFVWTPYSNGFSATLGGNFSTAGAFTQAGAFATTLTATGITNSTLPSGTHSLAPLDSPTFTGTPAAPTASANTNTTQIATTAFVVGQAGSANPLINGAAAPGTSLLFARQDHVHPTDTTRAPLASPALTGAPTAPTAAPGTNSTQLATTAYADAIAALKANAASPAFTGTATGSNVFPNALLSQAAASTLKGNPTGSTANVSDFTIGSLTQKLSPAGTDLILIQDQAASGVFKFAQVSSIASAGSVSSIDSKTGAFTTGGGLTSTGGNVIEIASPLAAQYGGSGVTSPSAHTIPVNEGSSAQANTGTGTAGQCLVSNGASADPSFISGCRVLLNTLTASGSTTLSDTTSLTSTYSVYEIVFINVIPATNANNCIILVHTAGGSFQTTNYTGTFFGGNNGGGVNTAGAGGVLCSSSNSHVPNTGNGINGQIRIYNPSQTATSKVWVGNFIYSSTSGNAEGGTAGGYWFGGNNAIDGFEVCFATTIPTCLSNGITSGVIKIYGLI